MEVLEFTDSSAIAKIQFDYEENQVGIAYTSNPDKFYAFKCDGIGGFKVKILDAFESGESVGKLISQLRKDGSLQSI